MPLWASIAMIRPQSRALDSARYCSLRAILCAYVNSIYLTIYLVCLRYSCLRCYSLFKSTLEHQAQLPCHIARAASSFQTYLNHALSQGYQLIQRLYRSVIRCPNCVSIVGRLWGVTSVMAFRYEETKL